MPCLRPDSCYNPLAVYVHTAGCFSLYQPAKGSVEGVPTLPAAGGAPLTAMPPYIFVRVG